MKVAVTLFRNGVSPRIDITDSLQIYDIEKGIVKNQEKCSLNFEQPAELVSLLQKKEIKIIICGGCPQFYLRALRFYGFELLHGLTGAPGHIIELFIDGKLENLPSSEPCGRRRRRKNPVHRDPVTGSDYERREQRQFRRGQGVKKNQEV